MRRVQLSSCPESSTEDDAMSSFAIHLAPRVGPDPRCTCSADPMVVKLNWQSCCFNVAWWMWQIDRSSVRGGVILFSLHPLDILMLLELGSFMALKGPFITDWSLLWSDVSSPPQKAKTYFKDSGLGGWFELVP